MYSYIDTHTHTHAIRNRDR